VPPELPYLSRLRIRLWKEKKGKKRERIVAGATRRRKKSLPERRFRSLLVTRGRGREGTGPKLSCVRRKDGLEMPPLLQGLGD